MSSVVFRSSVVIFLLLLFNAGSIALGALPYFYGRTNAFQIAQLAMAGAAFIIALLVPPFVIAKRGSRVYAEALAYLLISAVDVALAVIITLRWVNNNRLQKDYRHVPKRQMIIIMVVAVAWAASLTGFVGFFLAMVDSCSRAIRRDKKEQVRDGQIMTPPLPMQSPGQKPMPYTHPHTTYMRPGY